MEENVLDLKEDRWKWRYHLYTEHAMTWVVYPLWDVAGFYRLVLPIVWVAAVNYIISARPELCVLASWYALFLERNLFEF